MRNFIKKRTFDKNVIIEDIYSNEYFELLRDENNEIKVIGETESAILGLGTLKKAFEPKRVFKKNLVLIRKELIKQ